MNFHRMLAMTKKDIKLTIRERFFLYLIAFPIIAILILNAALGSIGAGTPSLAVYGNDDLADLISEQGALEVILLDSENELIESILAGSYDAGLVAVDSPKLYISGESLLNDRLTITASVSNALRESSGAPDNVVFKTNIVGEEELSLKVRLVPFLLILGTVIGGLIISSSLVEEREKRTLNAVMVTPLTSKEVILSKSLYGMFIGLVICLIVLILNNSLKSPLILLFLILGLGFTVGLGLMAGVLMDNITDLITRMKLFNIFMQFPALVILFPQIPQWLGMFFPTYYFVEPILSITQTGASIGDVWWKAIILLICDILVLYLTAKVLRKKMIGVEIV